jgi:hypothetical protein
MTSSAALTPEQWQIQFHETMAAVLRVQEAVKRQVGLWGILNSLWKCNLNLKAFIAKLKLIAEAPDGLLSEELIRSLIPQIDKLLRSIERLIDTAKHFGWMNRSLTSSPLKSIRSRGECIANYLDTLEMSIDPEVLKAIEEGRAQIQRGEFEVMERLFCLSLTR